VPVGIRPPSPRSPATRSRRRRPPGRHRVSGRWVRRRPRLSRPRAAPTPRRRANPTARLPRPRPARPRSRPRRSARRRAPAPTGASAYR
jgi:hypothetical protein